MTSPYVFFSIRDMVPTLRSLIDGGCGIVGGLEKISKINSRGGWNSRGVGKLRKT